MAFKISFVSDVKEVLRGNEAMEKGFDQTADSLDDLAREAKNSGSKVEKSLDDIGDAAKGAGNKIERELDDATKSAGSDADRLEKKFRDAFDEVKTGSKKTGDDLGEHIRKGTKEADEGLDTMSENAGSNAKEVAASFDGSFESMADGLQGFIAESLEGFGAIGLAGGVGIALALGIGLNALNEAAEKANALTEEAVDLGDALATAGSEAEAVQVLRDRFTEVANKIGDARSVWEVWQDRARTQGEQFADAIKQGTLSATALTEAFDNPDPIKRLTDLRKVSDDLQASMDRVAEAQAEVADVQNTRLGPAAQATNRQLMANLDVSRAAKKIIDDEIATQEAANAVLEAKATTLGLSVDAYREQQAATEKATAAQEAYTSALEGAADPVSTYEGLLSAKEEAERKTAEATAAATEDATDSWEDFKRDVSVSVDDLIAEWNRQAEAQETFEANLAVIAAQGGQAIADELRAKGPAVAGAAADTLAKAGDAKIREAAEAYGRANGSQVGRGMASGISGQQSAVQGSVDAVHRGIRVPSLNYPVHVDQAQAQDAVDKAARAIRKPTIEMAAAVGITRRV